jgi:O-antigen/teichoic acid export membrane protein
VCPLTANIESTILPFIPSRIKSLASRVASSPLGRRLAQGAFWSLIATLASRGLNVAAMVLVARVLGKAEFGEIGIIQSTVGMFQTFASFGLGWAATKYVSEWRKKDPAKAGRIIAFSNLVSVATGGIIAGAFYLAAPWLASHSLASPHLAGPLRVSSIVLLLGTLVGTQYGTLAGLEAFRALAWIGIVNGFLSVPLIFGGAWFLGVEGAVWGLAASYGINWILNLRSVRTEVRRLGIRLSFTGLFRERAMLWDFSIPAILTGTAYNVANWVCAAMLVRSGGYGEMGCYNAANQWFNVLIFLPGVLGQAAIPVLSEQLGENDLERSRKILEYSWKLNAVMIVPTAVFGSLFSPWIMGLYGDNFRTAWPTLVITLVSAAVCALQAPAGQLITAAGRAWAGAVMNFSYAVLFIASTAALLHWGSLGMAAGRTIAYCAYAAWSFKFAYTLVQRSASQPVGAC